MIYLIAFLVCLLFSLVSTWGVRGLANAKGWTHEPKTQRHMHTIPVPRLGGVAICASFMGTSPLSSDSEWESNSGPARDFFFLSR